MSKFVTPCLVAVSASLMLSACGAPLILGAAATAGYVGLQERPSEQVAKDSALKARIKGYLTDTQYTYLTDVGIDVYNDDVLVTGIVPTQADGEKVMRVVNATQGTRKVYNELFVGAAYSAAQKAKDAWITAQIQPRMLGTKGVYPLNYLITVVNNHVYVMGTCATADERNHALHILRTTRGVEQVHDYLTVAGNPKADDRANTIPAGESSSWLGAGPSGAPNPLPEE